MIATIDAVLDRPVAPLSPDDQPTKLTLVISGKESEDARWRQWQLKGRADEARFQRRLRTVLIDIAAVAAVGVGLWFALS